MYFLSENVMSSSLSQDEGLKYDVSRKEGYMVFYSQETRPSSFGYEKPYIKFDYPDFKRPLPGGIGFGTSKDVMVAKGSLSNLSVYASAIVFRSTGNGGHRWFAIRGISNVFEKASLSQLGVNDTLSVQENRIFLKP